MKPGVPWRPSRLATTGVLVVVAVAGLLRIWGLPRPPAGPYYDEAANVILATSIADEGYRPLFITAYTGKEVLFFYLTAGVMRLLDSGLLALRLTSAIVGTLTVAATFWCVYEMFSADPTWSTDCSTPAGRLDRCRARVPSWPPATPFWLALMSAALLATSLWHLVLSRVGLRAVAEPLLQAITLALLWRGLRNNRWRLLIVGGAFCGLTGYTYLAARLFPVPLALALLTLILTDHGRRRFRAAQAAVFVSSATAVFAPLGWYFWQNPQRFTVRLEQVAGHGSSLTVPQALIQALGMFFVRGDPLARFNLPGKPVFGPILATAFVAGIILVALRLVDRRPLALARGVLLATWIPVMILPTALTVSDIIPHSLRAAGMLPLVYVFPALGLLTAMQLAAGRRWRRSQVLHWLLLGVTLTVTASLTTHDYFVELAGRADHYEASDGDLADAAEWLNRNYTADTQIYVASVHYRHPTLALLARDYPSLRWLTGGRTVVEPSTSSAVLLVPRSVDWSWAEPYAAAATLLPVPPGPDGEPAFRAYQLSTGLLDNATHPADSDFGHMVQLEGYDLLEASRKTVDVVLHWRVLNPAPRDDYQVFAHLVDPWGFTWTETLPFQYPSGQWTPGERFIDRLLLTLPAGIPPGDYLLRVGLYSVGDNSNLPIVDADGSFGGLAAHLPIELSAGYPEGSLPLSGYRQLLSQPVGPGLQLVGYNLDRTSVRTREPLLLTLFWQADGLQDDYQIRLWLGQQLLYEGAPVHNTYPTRRWQPGEGVADRYGVRVPLDMPAGDWPLVIEARSLAADPVLIELGTITVTRPARSFTPPPMQVELDLVLGDQVQLLGYDLDRSGGGEIKLTLYWQCRQEMEQDFAVMVHALAADGAMVGQADSEPLQGQYPTSLWATGEVVADEHVVQVPFGASQPLHFRVGMYLQMTGQQLGSPVLLSPEGR